MSSDKAKKYQITVNGEIDPGWSDWLGCLSVRSFTTRNGKRLTLLTGTIPDQTALRGIMNSIWDLNLELVSIRRLPPSQR
ncbi:MAG: hypothetical protein IBX69_07885 [Anaerolineales bacterium]|nr:hypothetical protein [Anaerolineales bacterium]